MTFEEVIFYHGNGNRRLERRGNFENGRLNGEGEVISHYREGGVLSEWKGTFINDRLIEGEIIRYDRNGEIKERRDARDLLKFLNDRSLKYILTKR